jgi:hypothetical protein
MSQCSRRIGLGKRLDPLLSARPVDHCAECPRLSKGDRDCLVFRQA